jgi:hypothetical protein
MEFVVSVEMKQEKKENCGVAVDVVEQGLQALENDLVS